MNDVQVMAPLAEVLLPEDIVRGELVIIHGTPHIIDHVEPTTDPWTHRPALAVDTSRGRIIYLVLQCVSCDERAAMKYAASMLDMDWVEVRRHGEYHWLCPSCADPIVELLP